MMTDVKMNRLRLRRKTKRLPDRIPGRVLFLKLAVRILFTSFGSYLLIRIMGGLHEQENLEKNTDFVHDVCMQRLCLGATD